MGKQSRSTINQMGSIYHVDSFPMKLLKSQSYRFQRMFNTKIEHVIISFSFFVLSNAKLYIFNYIYPN